MELNKNILYSVAYGYTKIQKRPNQTNLCRFFWRVLLSAILFWPLFFILDIIIRGFGSIIAFLFFGLRPTSWKETCFIDKEKFTIYPFKEISWWWRTSDGFYVMPAPIYLLVFFILAVVVLLYEGFVLAYHKAFHPGLVFIFSSPLNIIIFFLVIAIALFLIIMETLRIEWWKLVKAYIKAKKEKVCPIIYFKDSKIN